MEECGRGAAVEQLTTRGMLSIPAMGAIGMDLSALITIKISIPAMGRMYEFQLNVNKPNI